ncbi:HoxN/HupN/NixA family nickel/cobalt transporter [Komagataeibacter xylinus]|uniref:Nickel/cobalt efflux system n=2 Tax=Komagataeibacter xylinus TaxID=28448 RepID=A0A318PKY2_KOMXY|nr:HoxN/HupN/NixA family nickel/cobalt transporter [Komagataeibacter xylinus]PYD58287.1 HoxN/HupN/NixA family nickel/cobalt transporter [Komagataeibacter xylinus]GBQ78765.1 high-affinity nickel permease [Komagataeibacter xylinus NBRC 15237]
MFMAARHGPYAIACALLLANLVAWAWAMTTLGCAPVLLGAAGLAWTFGLRHGLDADHIVAIDVVTRRLMQAGRAPSLVGLFFSLGHSTVVVLATLALVALPVQGWLEQWHLVGGGFGTLVSAVFMLAAVMANARMALGQWRALRQPARLPPPPAGFVFGWAGRWIGRSWQMYPLGFLFGLGFDTASEIGLLGMAAVQAHHGLGLAGVMTFPLLFTTGMALVDTLDTLLMCRAYGWGMRSGRRRVAYDLGISLVSLVAAAGIGAIELGQKLPGNAAQGNLLMRSLMAAGDHLAGVGAGIVLVFLALWGGAVVISRRQANRISPT